MANIEKQLKGDTDVIITIRNHRAKFEGLTPKGTEWVLIHMSETDIECITSVDLFYPTRDMRRDGILYEIIRN